jgi:F-type H+-transporting ATPase subunit a
MYQALEQFNTLNYKIFNFGFSNIFLAILVIFIFLLILVYIINEKNNLFLTKGFVKIVLRQSYIFILDVLLQNVGSKGIPFLPILFSIFYYICLVNFSGLLGYNLQLTSHIFVTFTTSIFIFIGIVIIGVTVLEIKFLNQFLPKDAPKALFPLLVVIEIISYIIRPFTLGIRLFANMFSGHVLLFVIINFIIVYMEDK